jgi:DEAD/DEAH box helicase domain-containing protein
METAKLFASLVKLQQRTIAFCGTRKLVELVFKYSVRFLEQWKVSHLSDFIATYRGGYTETERRLIERKLFNNELIGVAATCALELGIDVGSLDVTLHMGFPGSFSSLWQQAGRAGRSGKPSLSIIMCFDSALDQYFAKNPKILLESDFEKAILDVENVHILKSHLACAAKEIPLNYPFEGKIR